MHGMVRHTSLTTVGPLPDFKQMRMSVHSVQVRSLTAKAALTASHSKLLLPSGRPGILLSVCSGE